MAAKFARTDDFRAPIARLSYAQNLFKARAAKGSTREKFGCTLIFPKTELSLPSCKFQDGTTKSFEKIVADLIMEQWGEKGLERAKKGLIRLPWLAGDGKEARNKETGELHPGMGPEVFFIRTQANYDTARQNNGAPRVFPSTTSTAVPATQEEVYSGCYGLPVINFFCWNNVENGDGVSAGIQMFFKKADGEKIGGSGSADPDKWTETVEDTGAAPAETKTGAGAGGLFGAMG